MELGLYVHIPFCLRKCQYCDFVSYPFEGFGEEIVPAYLEGLGREMEYYREMLRDHCVDTVFIGGGTPTCLSPRALAGLLDLIRKNANLDAGAEITVEGNPGTIDREKAELLKEKGVNRVSLGVQSFNRALLGRLGRVHGAEEVYSSLQILRRAGFENISIDLMYALPGQDLETWKETLREAVGLGTEHVSAYALKIEKKTPFGEMLARGEMTPCDEDLECAMAEEARNFLPEQGYGQYEISNYARPGFNCRHNLKYWQYRPYLGLGVAAHSFAGGCRWANAGDIKTYLENLTRGEGPVDWKEKITPPMAMGEYMILGLRLRQGVSRGEFFRLFGEDIMELYGSALVKFFRLGLLEEEGDRLRLTARGMLLANEVMSTFV